MLVGDKVEAQLGVHAEADVQVKVDGDLGLEVGLDSQRGDAEVEVDRRHLELEGLADVEVELDERGLIEEVVDIHAGLDDIVCVDDAVAVMVLE